jgi:hypothetical protein
VSAPTYQLLPETSAPTYPYLPLPSVPKYPFAPSASAPVRPSRPRLPSHCRPQGPRPTSRTRHCVRARLHVCACLRDDVAVQVAANVDKVSQIYMAVNQCPFDPYRAGAKVYRAYRAGGRAGCRGGGSCFGVWGGGGGGGGGGGAGGPPHRQPWLLRLEHNYSTISTSLRPPSIGSARDEWAIGVYEPSPRRRRHVRMFQYVLNMKSMPQSGWALTAPQRLPQLACKSRLA